MLRQNPSMCVHPHVRPSARPGTPSRCWARRSLRGLAPFPV